MWQYGLFATELRFHLNAPCMLHDAELDYSKLCVVVAVPPGVLLDEIEAAEAEGNDERIEGLLCGAVKQLKMNRAKPDVTLYLSLMFLAKIKPNVFATEGVIEVGATCSVLIIPLCFSVSQPVNLFVIVCVAG